MLDLKIGGACKLLSGDGEKLPDANFGTTTVKKTSTLTKKESRKWLLALVASNLQALLKQLAVMGSMPKALRMWRISSDLLPLFTHDVARHVYGDKHVLADIEAELLKIGRQAQRKGLRLSFHPGQFVVLGSQNANVRAASMLELEYHCWVLRSMGLTGWHPNGAAVNVHVGLKEPNVKEMRKLLSRDTVRDLVTLENDEFSWCAKDIVETFGDLVPVVLDLHHYWLHQGKRIQPDSKLVGNIRKTWRSVKPKLHLAMSFPELCTASTENLVLQDLLDDGQTRAKLRVHCTSPWHARCIEYAAKFDMDIMWEGGDKNLGAAAIAIHLGLV